MGLLILKWREIAKMAKDYGHDNLGENSPHFDFSIVDYSVMNRGQILKLDSVGTWMLNKS